MPASVTARVHRWAENRVLAGAVLLAVLPALLVIARRDPALGGYPPCLFHAVTGLECPGCGGLRATHALLHGDLPAALRYDPLILLALPVLGLFVYDRFRILWGRPLPRLQLSPPGKWGWAVPVGILVVTVARNLR